MQNLKSKIQSFRFLNFSLINQRKLIFSAFTFAFLLFNFSCSIPNLEQPECTEARGAVKDFYSYHFGNEMKFTPENLQPREKFLTSELTTLLRKFVTESDPFTLTDDIPKAFRVSGCKVIDANKAEVGVLLFWRDDTRTEQKQIQVETIKQNDKWLINNIYNEQVNLQNNLSH